MQRADREHSAVAERSQLNEWGWESKAGFTCHLAAVQVSCEGCLVSWSFWIIMSSLCHPSIECLWLLKLPWLQNPVCDLLIHLWCSKFCTILGRHTTLNPTFIPTQPAGFGTYLWHSLAQFFHTALKLSRTRILFHAYWFWSSQWESKCQHKSYIQLGVCKVRGPVATSENSLLLQGKRCSYQWIMQQSLTVLFGKKCSSVPWIP